MLEQAGNAIEATAKALEPAVVELYGKIINASGTASMQRLVKQLEAAWFDPHSGVDDHGRGPKDPKDRAALAKATHKPATAEKQRWAEGNEKTVASMTGGNGTDDNKPTDVNVKIGSTTHGIEVKTLLEGSRDKVTMHPGSKDRKEAWARKTGGVLHTVVLDDRKAFGSKGYSGHRIYYRRGVGSFRLHTMTKVTGSSHLKKLMSE